MIRVHVLRAAIENNKRSGLHLPTVTVTDDDGRVSLGDAVSINGPSQVISDPSADPAVWIETAGPLVLRYKGHVVFEWAE
jgi:hypothetical protein